MSKVNSLCLMLVLALSTVATGAWAQTIEIRQWQGTNAVMRQPEQVVAGTMAEWRSLWARVGVRAPDVFEPGRTNAVGIFLGQRGPGHGVKVLSAVRRRDRIMLVFEELGPPTFMMAQRAQPPSRAVAGGPNFAPPPAASFAPPGAALMAPQSASPPGRPPVVPPSTPWAIVLINRTDLPVTVEQRLFR